MGYFMIFAAVPGFFVSAAILMGLSIAVCTRIGLGEFDYMTSMLVTITAWLTVAPLVAVGRKKRK